MCGFDDDWSCPDHKYEDGRMKPCPLGGCRKGCCARNMAADLERLTGEKVTMEQVHVG